MVEPELRLRPGKFFYGHKLATAGGGPNDFKHARTGPFADADYGPFATINKRTEL